MWSSQSGNGVLVNLAERSIKFQFVKKSFFHLFAFSDGFALGDELAAETLKPLSVTQIKQVRVLIDEAMTLNETDLIATEKERNAALREVGKIDVKVLICELRMRSPSMQTV